MKSLSKTLFAFYLLILLWLILFKFSSNLFSVFDQTRSLNLTPFADYSQVNLKEMVYNFVVFIPFGLFLSINLKQANFWRKLAVVFIFSMTVEMIQFVFAIGAADITDVITNTSGGFLGLTLYELSKKHVDTEKLDRFIAVAGTVLLTSCILFLGILLSNGVRYQSAPPAGKHRSRT